MNKPSLKKTLIVFAPHPDDETFGCGGTIVKKLQEGFEVFVVIMTDGRFAYKVILGIESNPTPEELKEIRKEEAKKATKILGLQEKNLIFLDFIDGTLKNSYSEAEEKATEILREKNPSEVYIPYKRDGHPDHRAANKIVKNAIKKAKISPVCYEYSITHRFARFGRFLDGFLYFIFRNKKICIDISDVLQVKVRAIAEYKSEIEIHAKKNRSIVNKHDKFREKIEVFYEYKIK